MRVIVVSDNHGNQDILLIIKHIYSSLYKNQVQFVHLGDSQSKKKLHGFTCVKGNNDLLDLPKIQEFQINHKKIYCTHGDEYEYSLEELYRTIDIYKPHIFLFGHTHCVIAEKYKNTLILNPGSITLPRDGKNGSYMILNIENNQVSYKIIRIDIDMLMKQYGWLISHKKVSRQ